MIRKLVTIACAAATSMGAACSPETVGRPPAPPVNWAPVAHAEVTVGPPKATAKERVAAEAYAKALGGTSFDRLRAALDEDAHFSFAGMKDAHGRDKVVESHEALFSAFDDRAFTPTRVWLTDTSQIVEWSMAGVQAREWMGVAATRKSVIIKGLTLLWTRDDGSVTDVHVIFDEEAVRVQIGAGARELAGLPAPSPAGPRQDFEQGQGAEEAANVAAVRASLNAFENGNEANYLDAFADDVEVATSERPQPLHGKADMRAYFKAMRKELAELDTSVDNAFGVGPFVVVEYDIIGTQMAPVGWIPLQHDRLLKFAVVDVVELKAGKIVHVWRYDNPAQVISKQ